MAIVNKTYVSKSNTIFKDKCGNNGTDPIMTISYGKELSRGLIYFDHTQIKEMVEDKVYSDISKLRHVLKMTNASSLGKIDMTKPCIGNMNEETTKRASSFDLIFFLINKEWDQGNGYYYDNNVYTNNNKRYTQDASNWYQYRNYFKWDEEGIYSNTRLTREYDKFTSKNGNLSNVIIASQHFDHGNENIEVDITDTVNDFITEKIPNYGIGIAFSPAREEEKANKTHFVAFFDENTHTFFQPYVETTYDETIEDDRTNFYLDKDNRLYFYASVGGNYINLDETPTCTINGAQMASKQATRGIYYVNVNLSSDEYEPDTMIYDVWSNIKYKGKTMNDVELSFVTKPSNGYFSFGLPSQNEETEFVPSVYGINQQEQVKSGEIRKVNIECRIPYTTNQLRSVDGIDYRLYVMEGTSQYDVIAWTKVERAYNENYFLINTAQLIPSRYYVDIRVHRNLELIEHPKTLQFDIVNDVTDKN